VGRPRRAPEDRVQVPIRMPRELHEQLHRIADERDTSLNHLVLKAAQHYIGCLPPIEPVAHGREVAVGG
jgi:predicted HicB family RNase H-like nuclease